MPNRRILALLCATVVLLAASAGRRCAAQAALAGRSARKRVGDDIVVEMTVKTAKDRLEKRGEIYLDAELDFRDEKNFATVINRDGAALFQQQGVTDFEEHFRGKKLRVKGRVTVVDEVPRIEVSDPDQVEIVKSK